MIQITINDLQWRNPCHESKPLQHWLLGRAGSYCALTYKTPIYKTPIYEASTCKAPIYEASTCKVSGAPKKGGVLQSGGF